ncbi:MAG TPA: PP2C family protein-serine/threonine phosphatase [Vicinamibacterales bacterium]|nr:PP2C family protein-serine/threonine phosphatase [Vicinamibacterales bacterium]
MPQPVSPEVPSEPRLLDTLGNDVKVVVEDILHRGVRRSVGGTLAGLEAFYLSREERRQLAELRGPRRLGRRVWWFVRGLLLKLTPARRIMLAAGLLALLLGVGEIRVNTVHLALRVQGLGILLLFTVLVLELKDKLVARNELEAGRAVQIALTPTDQPSVAGWDIWLYTRPANDVGGDLVDHLAVRGNQHAVLLGDVTGKALPAALLSVKLQATIRALEPYFDDLGDLAAGVNRILYRDGLPTRFASLVYALVTPHSGRVRLLNAGHMPPLHLHGDTVTTLPRGSMVIGMMPDVTFSEQQVDLEVGDRLVVYSDGVSEAMNEAEDFFGDERLEALVRHTSAMSAADAGAYILDDVTRFVGTADQSDDVSLLVLRRTGGAGAGR